MQLNGKRILLTGATGGIGQPIALLLAAKGARLALVGRSAEKLASLKKTLVANNGEHIGIVADFDITGTAQRVANEAKLALGDIDILINIAGVLDFVEFQHQPDERIAQMINTNVTALIQLTRAVIPQFLAKNQGHFVFIGSIFGSLGFPHYATYCASKFAVHGFSQALRRELLDAGIGVTYVAPRGIKTAMNDANATAMYEKSGNTMDSPEHVANIVVNALEQEKQEVFVGQPQSLFAWLNGVAPKLVNIGLKKQTALARDFLGKASR
ncbi:MAG: short chain dehydrogenase [Betaproteobacteria bacterium HGW-Betaproteobacteria-20]|jgi:short-subunit dehydrogenase|nr:MAG: short chain dehydrogenase [Betaproteobacteria bacterium HGW-Betaproteobacteria-20]